LKPTAVWFLPTTHIEEDGRTVRKQKCVKLCDVRPARSDLELLIKVHLAEASLSEFVDDHYLAWIEENKSAAFAKAHACEPSPGASLILTRIS
jgi:hypothetical protein